MFFLLPKLVEYRQNIKKEKTTYHQSKHLKQKKKMFKSINAVSIPVVLGTPASP